MDRPGTDLTPPLTDPSFYAGDPHALFERLRATGPLTWCPDPGFWAVSTHAEVMEASADPVTFCSGRGVLIQDIGAEVPDIPGALLYVDPPDHTRYRKLVQPAFTPSRMRSLEPGIRRRVRALLDGVAPGVETDVVASLAVPFPIQVIADLLGVPESDWADFYAWSDAYIAAADGGREISDEVLGLTGDAINYLLATVAERRVDPRADLITELALVEVDGDRLNDGELIMFLVQLLVAGNETTRNLVSGGLVALAEHPDQWLGLREGTVTIESTVEELLRWTTPVISFLRTATRDTRLGGQQVAAGEPLLLLYASANRDRAVFGESADRLDLARDPNHHVAFGFGTHFCLGAMLARIEARVLLEEVLARYTSLDLAGPVQRTQSTVIAGLATARMVLT